MSTPHRGPASHVIRSERLYWLDFFRGLALVIVLLDHMDWWAGDPVFREWTLMGLGFSDAAEAFVFLSGFTFGWVYNQRMAERGFLYCQGKAIVRSAQIFAGYLFTVSAIGVLAWMLRDIFSILAWDISFQADGNLEEILAACCLLRYQPFALGILCFYILVLPLMPAMLALARWSVLAAVLSSALLYVAVQWNPQINLSEVNGDWFFNPAAWQLMMVFGLVLGAYFRRTGTTLKERWPVLFVALLMLGAGVITKKSDLISGWGLELPAAWLQWTTSERNWLFDKTRLAPFRILHFAALAYVIACLAPRKSSLYKQMPFRAIGNCGRVPLRTYCVGTVLVSLSAVARLYIGSSWLVTLLVGFDLVLVQCALAALMIHCSSKARG